MLLWSIVPQEVVWEGFDKAPVFREVVKNGKYYLFDQEGKVERIISTDPADYL